MGHLLAFPRCLLVQPTAFFLILHWRLVAPHWALEMKGEVSAQGRWWDQGRMNRAGTLMLAAGTQTRVALNISRSLCYCMFSSSLTSLCIWNWIGMEQGKGNWDVFLSYDANQLPACCVVWTGRKVVITENRVWCQEQKAKNILEESERFSSNHKKVPIFPDPWGYLNPQLLLRKTNPRCSNIFLQSGLGKFKVSVAGRRNTKWDISVDFAGGTSGKESSCQCRRHKRPGYNPWVRKTPWRRAWQPIPVFSLEHPMDRGAWLAMVRGVSESQTWLGNYHICKCVKCTWGLLVYWWYLIY